MYRVDFTVDMNITGGQKYNFFLDGLYPPGPYTPFLHASNAALSGSTQQGADGLMLYLDKTTGLVTIWDSYGNGWDKSSDFNVQVQGSQVPLPGTVLLLGSGLAGLAFYRRRRSVLKG